MPPSLALKSKYSKLLYCLLKDNLYRGEWLVEVKDLRELLWATDASWESFKEFNRRILKAAMGEINNNTDISFTYDKVTRGRLTRAVKFKIQSKIVAADELDGQASFSDPESFDAYVTSYQEEDGAATAEAGEDPVEEKFALWSDACKDEFDRSQIELLALLAKPHVEYDPDNPDRHDLDIYYYLRTKYKALNAKPAAEVKSRIGLMKHLVKTDGV